MNLGGKIQMRGNDVSVVSKSDKKQALFLLRFIPYHFSPKLVVKSHMRYSKH